MQNTDSPPQAVLRFRLTMQEYIALLRATKYTWAERVSAMLTPAAYWGLALILTMPFLFSRAFRQTFHPYFGSFAPVIIVVLLGALFYAFHTFVLFPWLIRDTLAGQLIGQGESEISLTEQGIISRLGKVVSEIPWDAVQRVADARGCIILFTGRNSGLILPRRAFDSQAEADRILAFAKLKTGAAQ
ncbi:MAG TPA: YcxB family protein [Xanthobacteraceae bacterium]|nr:YcxB family protein [Xanthobacteraceae bacterium]